MHATKLRVSAGEGHDMVAAQNKREGVPFGFFLPLNSDGLMLVSII